MLGTIDRLQAWAFGQLIEQHALAGDWEGMRRLEAAWVQYSEHFHGRDRTELCQTENDSRHTMRLTTHQDGDPDLPKRGPQKTSAARGGPTRPGPRQEAAQ